MMLLLIIRDCLDKNKNIFKNECPGPDRSDSSDLARALVDLRLRLYYSGCSRHHPGSRRCLLPLLPQARRRGCYQVIKQNVNGY